MQLDTIVSDFFKRVKLLQNFIYPHSCLKCDTHLDEFSGLCACCAQDLVFVGQDYCKYCGLPFELSVGHQISCASCLQKKPPYQSARALFVYEEHIKELILKFKYADAHYIRPFFVRQMAHFINTQGLTADYIIPVPSHYRRLIMRKFNPVALLVDSLEKQTQIPVLMHALKRVKFKTQKGYTKSQREKHLSNAFVCSDKMRDIIRDKKIMLVDDVMTTGATVRECSKTLLKAGASSVIVLTLARTTLTHNYSAVDF